MKSALALPLIGLTLMVGAQSVNAETLYRVEVLVFAHLSGTPDRWPEAELRDFSALLDPRQRAELAAWTARPAAAGDAMAGSTATGTAAAASDSSAEAAGAARDGAQAQELRVLQSGGHPPLWPSRFVDLGELSHAMAEPARRLENSPEHQLLTRLAWLQPLDRRAGSAVRVHDGVPIRVDWPASRATGFLHDAMVEGPDPMPITQYRLDGSFQLRQRQFRHVELDLVWREPVLANGLELADPIAAYLTHGLRQSRPVQLGRLEYFDSAWLGVLVLIEEWERPEPSAQPAAGG